MSPRYEGKPREGREMTETVADVGSLGKTIKRTVSPSELERAAIRELVIAARA
jgi:hypothetical protein